MKIILASLQLRAKFYCNTHSLPLIQTVEQNGPRLNELRIRCHCLILREKPGRAGADNFCAYLNGGTP